MLPFIWNWLLPFKFFISFNGALTLFNLDPGIVFVPFISYFSHLAYIQVVPNTVICSFEIILITFIPFHCHCYIGSLLMRFLLLPQFSSVQSLSRVRLFATHELQQARPPCPSPTPRVHSNSRPSSRWCHPTISSSVIPFSSCLQSFPASGSFPMSQFFASGGQSIGVSALASSSWFCFLSLV